MPAVDFRYSSCHWPGESVLPPIQLDDPHLATEQVGRGIAVVMFIFPGHDVHFPHRSNADELLLE